MRFPPKHTRLRRNIHKLKRLDFNEIQMNRETAAKGDQTTVLGWHRGEGGLLVGEADQVSVDLSSVSLKLMLLPPKLQRRGLVF